MSDWQTMDSAPKDGTKIDLWAQSLINLADGGQQVAVEFRVPDAAWFGGEWCDPEGNPHDYLDGFANVRVTHWRPLPPPP